MESGRSSGRGDHWEPSATHVAARVVRLIEQVNLVPNTGRSPFDNCCTYPKLTPVRALSLPPTVNGSSGDGVEIAPIHMMFVFVAARCVNVQKS